MRLFCPIHLDMVIAQAFNFYFSCKYQGANTGFEKEVELKLLCHLKNLIKISHFSAGEKKPEFMKLLM